MKNSNLIDRQMFGNKSNFVSSSQEAQWSSVLSSNPNQPSLSPDQNYDLRTSKLLFRMFIIFHAFLFSIYFFFCFFLYFL